MEQKQVFISHSQQDTESLKILREICAQNRIKAVQMEYEGHIRAGRANWDWVRDEIEKSVAFVLILTKNAIAAEYTKNWIAWEIGVAANCKPPKQVCVIKEEEVYFPLPYLSLYIPHPLLRASQSIRWDTPELTRFMKKFGYAQLYPIVAGTIDNVYKGQFPVLKCMDCLIEFMMFPIHYQIICCPCCDLGILWEAEKWCLRDTEGNYHPPIQERQPCKRASA
jgi:hypothetical protein